MRTLVYKRTHNGDPDEQGVFGINDCMGTVRARDFDAVIGVGGVGDEPRREGIAEKITWIGIGPHKSGRPDRPQVTFDHYLFFGPRGPLFRDHAPVLAQHVYGWNVRTLMTFTHEEQQEVDALLALAESAPPSQPLSRARTPAGVVCNGTERPAKPHRCCK
jgi:hypothetical protein